MDFLKNLFRKKPAAPQSDKNSARIKCFDEFGREVFVSREDWRTSVLPHNLKSSWDNPDALYSMITSALTDGFRDEVAPAAMHLYETDPNRERGTLIWGVVLLEQGKLASAQSVFEDYLKTNPNAGYILTNLAKVIDRRGDKAKAEEILLKALTADPNQENGLAWFVAIHRDRAGEREALKACRQIAAVRGSWLPQLWMARDALKAGEKREALTLYQQALASAGTPPPEPLLMRLSGDLGMAGHLRDLVNLTQPLFDPAVHGLPVGSNLIKANIELRDFDQARHILDQLYAQKRPDWKEHLSFWDTELAKARIATDPSPEPSHISMLTIDGPAWLVDKSPAASLFPPKSPDDFLIGFLSATVNSPEKGQEAHRELTDSPGRLSRALPLFIDEHVYFSSRARTHVLVPWMSERAGFVLFGRRQSDEEVFEVMAGAANARNASAYHCLVVPHVDTVPDPWTIDVRILRCSDHRCIAQIQQPLSIKNPTSELLLLAESVLRALVDHAEIHPATPPPHYRPPTDKLAWYTACLEQLLAVRCAAMESCGPDFLHGARDILDGMIGLCLDAKDNPTLRLLTAQTALSLKKAKPEILPEFREKLTSLQREGALPPEVTQVVNTMFKEALS